MTKGAALARACALFGKTAAVKARKCFLYEERPGNPRMCSGVGCHAQPCPSGLPLKSIGKIEMGGLFFLAKAEGTTWEAAFEKHEANERRDHEQFVESQKKKPCDCGSEAEVVDGGRPSCRLCVRIRMHAATRKIERALGIDRDARPRKVR